MIITGTPGVVVDAKALETLLAATDRILATSAATQYLKDAREAFRTVTGRVT